MILKFTAKSSQISKDWSQNIYISDVHKHILYSYIFMYCVCLTSWYMFLHVVRVKEAFQKRCVYVNLLAQHHICSVDWAIKSPIKKRLLFHTVLMHYSYMTLTFSIDPTGNVIVWKYLVSHVANEVHAKECVWWIYFCRRPLQNSLFENVAIMSHFFSVRIEIIIFRFFFFLFVFYYYYYRF